MNKDRIWAILLSSFWLIMIVAWFWPASFWLSVDDVHVFDSTVGSPIYMSVDRTIHRPFYGEWSVTVRKINTGKKSVVCVSRGRSDYITEAVFPEDLSLDWWTDGKCKTLKIGKYILTTSWSIDAMFSSKKVKAVSNEFAITSP